MATCSALRNCDAWRDFRTLAAILRRPAASVSHEQTLLLIEIVESMEVRYFTFFQGEKCRLPGCARLIFFFISLRLK